MRAFAVLLFVHCGGRLTEEPSDATVDDAIIARTVDSGTHAGDAFAPDDAGTVPGADVRCPLRDGGYVTCTAPGSYCCLNKKGATEGRCVAPESIDAEACAFIYCDGLGDCADGSVCCAFQTFGVLNGNVTCLAPSSCWDFDPNTRAKQVCVPGVPEDGCAGNASCKPTYPLGGFWGVCGP